MPKSSLLWETDRSPSRRLCLNFEPALPVEFDGRCWRVQRADLNEIEFSSFELLDATLTSIVEELGSVA